MKRKLLSVLLTFCLAFSLLPTAALADGEETPQAEGGKQKTYVAQIDDKQYETLQAAVDAAKGGDTIVLKKSISATEIGEKKQLQFEKEAMNLTLDLNQNTITAEAGEAIAVHAANITLIVKNGTIKNFANGKYSDGVYAYKESNNLTLTFENIVLESRTQGLAVQGLTSNSNVNIVNSKITSTEGLGIYYPPKSGTLTITDSEITGVTGIVVKGSNLVVNGEKTIISGTGPNVDPDTYYTGATDDSSSLTETGDALYIESGYNDRDITVAVQGGSFTSANAQAVRMFIQNGEITSVKREVKVTGGTFSSDVSAYVADGYILNNGTVEKLGETNAVAKIGGTYYKTLAEAVSAADNNTVTLLKDTAEDVVIPAGKTVTLDLNGKKLTNVSGHTITNNGTLFVTGNGTVDNIAHGKGALYNNTGATATLNGGTFTRSAEKGTASPDSANGNSWYTVKNYGTMTINSNVTITNTGSHSSAVANGWFDVSKAGSNGEPTRTADADAVLTINGGNISGGKITVKNDDYGMLSITGGSISQPLNGLYCIYNANVTAISGGNVNGPVGNYKGVSTEADQGKFSITGGYFTSKPAKEYIATGYYVVASDKAGYSCMISGTAPTKAEVIVNDKTAVTAPTNKNLTDADKTAIQTKTNIDGVAEAVAGSKDAIVKKAGVDASKVEKDKLIEVEVAVDVAVSDVQKNEEGTAVSSITFTAKPTATVKVDGTAKETKVPVTNDMLNGKAITVTLPLPAGFDVNRLEQVKHISENRGVEYFLKTPKTGAKTFEIDATNNCVILKITHFSTFELSGTVTYVEPSYSSGSSSYDPTYSVSTPSKTEHGTVTVSPKSASKGDTVTVTVKPDSGYVLETLTVTDKNGNELTLKDKGNGKYTFTMPAGKVEVKATFMEDNSVLNFFYDVPNGAYFYEAVKWAVENGITTGVGNDLFAPEQPCTRAQIVTFLWRAAGSPEPKGAASGMSDVVSGSYYEKAVAWAIENGITTGTTTSTFSPDATCTRAQAVTFLARALKAKAASAAEFSDVPTGSYFADAVAWAAANGVTEGIGGGLFGSDNDCTRGQIVTFLYRAYNK